MSAPALSRQDWTRLTTLQERVEGYMLEAYDKEGSAGGWRTLHRIQAACGGTEASCSARLRQAEIFAIWQRIAAQFPALVGCLSTG